jgi:hypothetical protein
VRSEFKGKLFTVKTKEKHKLILALKKYPGTASAFPFGDSLHVTFSTNSFDNSFLDYLRNEGIKDAVIEESLPGIEDRFLQLMNKRNYE